MHRRLLCLLVVLLSACGGGDGNINSPTEQALGVKACDVSGCFAVGGTVLGLVAHNSLVLQNNFSTLTIKSNGAFTFAAKQPNLTTYNVTVSRLPASQACSVTYGMGTIDGARVNNVNVFCGPTPVGAFVPGSSAAQAREFHSATLMSDGRVLVVGGYGPLGIPLLGVDIYDSGRNTWTIAAGLSGGLIYHSATLLPNGKVLVAGGVGLSGGNVSPACYLYDPITNTWAHAANLATARARHTATLMANGTVLIAGGVTPSTTAASAELYDPGTNLWSSVSGMSEPRQFHTATLMTSGKVLVAGGIALNGYPTPTAEIYDPAQNLWSSVQSLPVGRAYHTATLLPNGRALIAGGLDQDTSNNITFLTDALVFEPSTSSWSAAGALATARIFHTATLMPTGKVLIAGGGDVVSPNFLPAATAELYDLNSNAWAATGSLENGRGHHSSTLLSNGKAFLFGGESGPNAYLPTADLYW